MFFAFFFFPFNPCELFSAVFLFLVLVYCIFTAPSFEVPRPAAFFSFNACNRCCFLSSLFFFANSALLIPLESSGMLEESHPSFQSSQPCPPPLVLTGSSMVLRSSVSHESLAVPFPWVLLEGLLEGTSSKEPQSSSPQSPSEDPVFCLLERGVCLDFVNFVLDCKIDKKQHYKRDSCGQGRGTGAKKYFAIRPQCLLGFQHGDICRILQ